MRIVICIVCSFLLLKLLAFISQEKPSLDKDNPYLAMVENENKNTSFYQRGIKPVLGSLLSYCGLVILSPIYLIVAILLYIDDPGDIFFCQKRVGKDGKYFYIHKFRTMKMETPHDMPTHLLANPDFYITRVGKVLRKTSLDELPQIWDIFRGKMAVIGPRPALYNQADLMEERSKYDANTVVPGLTGWAQVNGRDELSIAKKSYFDGEYTKKMKEGGMHAFAMDVLCFIRTIHKVAKADGVQEGKQE